MNYIVIDLEYNQPFDFTRGQKAQANPRCPLEVIQIGAVKLDGDFEIIESFDTFIKPRIYRRLHPYVAKITGIHSRDLHKAPLFSKAYAALLEFIGGDSVLCTWGPDDVKELYRNILYHSLPAKAMTRKYINVQSLAGAHLKRNSCTGLKTAVEELGLMIDRPFHNALNDAVYTAAVLKLVRTQDMRPEAVDINRLALGASAKAHSTNVKLLFSFVEGKMKRRLSDKDRDIILTIYNAGREKRFDATQPQEDGNALVSE